MKEPLGGGAGVSVGCGVLVGGGTGVLVGHGVLVGGGVGVSVGGGAGVSVGRGVLVGGGAGVLVDGGAGVLVGGFCAGGLQRNGRRVASGPRKAENSPLAATWMIRTVQ